MIRNLHRRCLYTVYSYFKEWNEVGRGFKCLTAFVLSILKHYLQGRTVLPNWIYSMGNLKCLHSDNLRAFTGIKKTAMIRSLFEQQGSEEEPDLQT